MMCQYAFTKDEIRVPTCKINAAITSTTLARAIVLGRKGYEAIEAIEAIVQVIETVKRGPG